MAIYLFHRENDGLTKIGRSVNYNARFRDLNSNFRPITVRGVFESLHPIRDEAYLHKVFEICRVQGEWFRLTDKHVDWIRDYFAGSGPVRIQKTTETTISYESVVHFKCKCDRCGHRWITRSAKPPKVCPACKRENWNDQSLPEIDECEAKPRS